MQRAPRGIWGSLKPDKRAGLVLLSDNPTGVPDPAIRDSRIIEAVKIGRIVSK